MHRPSAVSLDPESHDLETDLLVSLDCVEHSDRAALAWHDPTLGFSINGRLLSPLRELSSKVLNLYTYIIASSLSYLSIEARTRGQPLVSSNLMLIV